MRTRGIGVLVALALLGTACNGNDVPDTPEELMPPDEAQDVLDVTGDTEATVVIQDFFFSPTQIVGTPGQALRVELQNIGDAAHTFTVDDAAVDQEVAAGAESSVDVVFPDTGSVGFVCRFHAGMQGSLSVDGAAPDDAAGSGGGYGSG